MGELIGGQPNRVTGVRINDRATGESASLAADLIIDATGRGTRTPLLLEQLGYSRPPQRSFTADGIYHSQTLAIDDHGNFPEKMVLVLDQGSGRRGGLAAYENDTWMLTVAGRATENALNEPLSPTCAPPRQTFCRPTFCRRCTTARALGGVSTYRYPGGVWHRYDQMADYPDGLLVLGDALCCLDPINGQGMTLAALHALTLRDHLRRATPVAPQQYYREVSTRIAPVWMMNQPTEP